MSETGQFEDVQPQFGSTPQVAVLTGSGASQLNSGRRGLPEHPARAAPLPENHADGLWQSAAIKLITVIAVWLGY